MNRSGRFQGGGGGYADSRWGSQSGGYNQRGMQRKGRSWGEQEGDKLRGMSPTSAARYIEARMDAKERNQRGTYDVHSREVNQQWSRSRTRSLSLSPRRSHHSFSPSPVRSRGRSWRSPGSDRSAERSLSPRKYSPSPPSCSRGLSSDDERRRSDDNEVR